MARYYPCFMVILALAAACESERRAPTGPPALQQESVVIRFERSTSAAGSDEVLTITGLGHVTWREVQSGAVARLRISVDELLMLERAFDDARLDDLPEELRGSACEACPMVVLTRGVAAGERSVVLTGDPRDHPREVRDLVARLDGLTGRARAERSAAMGGGGTARDRLPGGLDVALSLGRPSIHPGESLYLRLTVSNPTDRPIRLSFPTSATADFRVESTDGGAVWALSGERAALQLANDVVLAPGESRSFEEVWLGRTDEGDPVSPGSYYAVGIVPAERGGETPPVAFQVR